jgi:hypothetical protein
MKPFSCSMTFMILQLHLWSQGALSTKEDPRPPLNNVFVEGGNRVVAKFDE